eukprot:5403290-Prymnesium_polylepis.1
MPSSFFVRSISWSRESLPKWVGMLYSLKPTRTLTNVSSVPSSWPMKRPAQRTGSVGESRSGVQSRVQMNKLQWRRGHTGAVAHCRRDGSRN